MRRQGCSDVKDLTCRVLNGQVDVGRHPSVQTPEPRQLHHLLHACPCCPCRKQTAHLKPGFAEVARDPCLDASASVAALAAACTSMSGHHLSYWQQKQAVQQEQ